MVDKMIYFLSDDTQKLTFCRLELEVEPLGHSVSWTNESKLKNKFPKLLSQQIRTRYYKTLGTNKQPNVPSIHGE